MARHRHRDDDIDDLPKVPINWQTLREAWRMLSYLWPYRLKFAAALLALLVSSVFGLAFPAVTGRLVDAALTSNPADGPLPWHRDINWIALGLMAILAIQAAFAFLEEYWTVEVGERSLADLRRDAYARMIHLPMAFHAQRRVGELSSRIAADLSQIQDTLVAAVPHLLRQSAMLVGGVALIAWTSGRLTLVMLSSFPILIGAAAVFGRAIRRHSKDAQDRLADSNVIVEETLQGIASVKGFANESYEEGRYRDGLQDYLKAVLSGAKYRGAFVAFIVFALFGAMVLVLWYGARLVHTGDLRAGELTSFLLYTVFVGGAMGSFAGLYSQLQRTLGATQRVRELLRELTEDEAAPPASIRLPSPSPLPPGERETKKPSPPEEEGRVRGARIRGDVAFDHVAFTYPSRKEVTVLRDVSLTARAGERIALVGPSGAGKSTIVSLLLRFYEPDGGRVLIDGRNAREYGLKELRGQMAVVPQDVLLFGGTIFDNIAYGRPGAGEAEVVEAARRANAHDFITSFPDGYQTRVGERGVQLSGGQRQRVAIARAILRDPAILLLDEATSSLDSESESLVLQALERLMQGRTSLVIAHRLATVRSADRIYVVRDGTIVESGTHEELVAVENGVYRNLSQLQFSDNTVSNGSLEGDRESPGGSANRH
jgi:ATP-binding cassette subfamily B protein